MATNFATMMELRRTAGSLRRLGRRLAVMVKGKCEHRYCSRPQHKYGLCRWHWAACVRNTVAIMDAIWPPSKPPTAEVSDRHD